MTKTLGRTSVRWYAVSVLLAAIVAGSSPVTGSAATATAAKATVSIDNFRFNEQELKVKAGTEVTWVNRDDSPHKIVSQDRLFASPVLDTDGRFSYTFKTAGTYAYYCSLHPMMTGKVVVQ